MVPQMYLYMHKTKLLQFAKRVTTPCPCNQKAHLKLLYSHMNLTNLKMSQEMYVEIFYIGHHSRMSNKTDYKLLSRLDNWQIMEN